MRKEIQTITINKEKKEVELRAYENIEELLSNETESAILEAFNAEAQRQQIAEYRKKMRPKKLSIKEKRLLAFNDFSLQDLQSVHKDYSKFESLLEQKMKNITNS